MTARADLTGHPGATDTFNRPCLSCGTTLHVVDGRERPHEHAAFTSWQEMIATAWWAGYDEGEASTESARPATLAASQPSGVLPEGPASSGAREAAYAEAIGLQYPFNNQISLDRCRAVMAVADAEQAELQAELERLRAARDECERQFQEQVCTASEIEDWRLREVARAEAAEAERDRLREAVRLAAGWIGSHTTGCTVPDAPCSCGVASARADLAAVLADAAPDPTPNMGEAWADTPDDAPPRIPDRCTCGAPEAYSLNPAEVVTHRTDGPCTIGPAASSVDDNGTGE